MTEARRDKQIKGGRNATKFLSRAAGEPGAGFSLPKGKFLPSKTCVKYGGIKNGKVINMALATRKAALTRVPRITCYPCAVRHKRLLSSHHQRSFFVTGLTRVAQELVSWANVVSRKHDADLLCRLNFSQNSSSRISFPHNDLQNSLKNSNLVSQFLPFSPCIKVRGTLKTKGGL